MKHKRRNPAPKRPHRKRGLAPSPSPAPSPALVETRRRLEDRLLATRAALQVERVRAGTSEPGEALRGLAELWSSAYADG